MPKQFETLTEKYERIMNEIQSEWETNKRIHTNQREKLTGIRSSQISALVRYLINKGILK